MPNIQYAVGQGGLHLGIADKIAYIYDCGGWGKLSNVDWNNIFLKIVGYIRNCESLHIYISHFHSDHCNKLNLLLKVLPTGLNIKFHYPQITPIQKIMALVDFTYDADDNEQQEMSYAEYYEFVSDTDIYIKEQNKGLEIIPISISLTLKKQDNKIKEQKEFKTFSFNKAVGGVDFFLDSYVILHNRKKIGAFRKSLQSKGWNDEKRLLSDIKNSPRTLTEIRNIYRKNVGLTHGTMLCLYAGYCCQQHYNWLHTGDISLLNIMKTGFYRHYSKYLHNKNYIQVPHHGSKNNHDKSFNFLNPKNTAIFFLTCQQNPSSRGSQHVNTDVTLISSLVHEVKENISSKISI